MPDVKRMLCLAASRKHHGYCFAGKETDTGQWIRPISARPGHEISEYERITEGGERAGLLDVLEVSLIRPVPTEFQSENYLNNQAVRWRKAGVGSYHDAAKFLDPDQPLWINGPSSYNGLHDQVPEGEAANLHDSLRLIRVPDLSLLVHSEGGVFGPAKRVVRAQFAFLGETYWLKLTDPALEAELRQREDGEYHYHNAIMCVSLGEVFNGYAYKLVASVILEQAA